MQRAVSFLLPAILWLIISTVLLILPGSSIPKEDWLDKIWFDKWAHIGIFFILVFLWCRAMLIKRLKNDTKRTIVLITVVALFYGTGMEFIQKYFIPNRSFDMLDIVANALGCGMGMIFFLRRSLIKVGGKGINLCRPLTPPYVLACTAVSLKCFTM